MSKYQRFSKEFKLEAVRLLEAGDKPAAEIALDLGLRRNQLYKWRDQLRDKGDAAFSGKRGRPPADQASEVARLKKELEQVKLERDILKKRRRTSPKTCHEVRLDRPAMLPRRCELPRTGRIALRILWMA